MESFTIEGENSSEKVPLRRQVLPALIMCLTGCSYGFGVAFTSVKGLIMLDEGVLSSDEMSFFASAFVVGVTLGCPLAAPLADRFGLKSAAIFAMVFCVMGWAIIAGVSTAPLLCSGRLLTGTATGILYVTVHPYICEITTERFRGSLAMVSEIVMIVCILVDLSIGVFIPWRYLALVAASSSTLVLLATLKIPESPRWLLLRGRSQDALRVLRYLRGSEAEFEYNDIMQSSLFVTPSSSGMTPNSFWKKYFNKPFILAITVSVIYHASGINIVLSYFDIIVSRLGWKDNIEIATITFGVIQFVAGIISLVLITRVPRRTIVIVSLMSLSIACTILGFLFCFNEIIDTTVMKWMSLTSLMIYGGSFQLGVGPACPLLRAELLPNRSRIAGSSIAVFVSHTFGYAITQAFPYVPDFIGFFTFTAMNLFSIFTMVRFVPETKGLSIEEIETLFNNNECEPLLRPD